MYDRIPYDRHPRVQEQGYIIEDHQTEVSDSIRLSYLLSLFSPYSDGDSSVYNCVTGLLSSWDIMIDLARCVRRSKWRSGRKGYREVRWLGIRDETFRVSSYLSMAFFRRPPSVESQLDTVYCDGSYINWLGTARSNRNWWAE